MPAPMPRKRNTIIAQGRVPSHRSNAQPMATPTATATTSSKPIRKPKLSAARASLTPLSEGVPEAGRSRPRRALSSRSSRSRRGSRVSRSSIGEPPAKREKTSPRSRPPRRRNGAELTGRLRECQGAERADALDDLGIAAETAFRSNGKGRPRSSSSPLARRAGKIFVPSAKPLPRHGRAGRRPSPGHPRLADARRKTWMPGTSTARRNFRHAMTGALQRSVVHCAPGITRHNRRHTSTLSPRGRGRDPRRRRGRVRGWPIACLPISCVKQPPLLRNGPFLSREGRGTPGRGNADLALLRRLHRLDEQLGGRRRAEEHPHLVDEPVFPDMHQVNFVKGHSLYLARELDGMPAVGGFAKSDEGKTVHRLLDLAEVRGNAVNACRGRIARGRMHLDRRGELSADLFPIALQYAGDVVLQSFHHLQTSRCERARMQDGRSRRGQW